MPFNEANHSLLDLKQSLIGILSFATLTTSFKQNFITAPNVLSSKKVDANEIRHIHV
jgi:hypothetical protein